MPGKITEKVIEQWKPILADAIHEWAKQQTLTIALQNPNTAADLGTAEEGDESIEKSERHGLRRKFWDGLLSRPKAKGTRHADLTPGEYNWIGAGSGVRGLPFVYVIAKDEGRVELYIDRGAGTTEENKSIFETLHMHKDEIEKVFGGALSWQRLDDK